MGMLKSSLSSGLTKAQKAAERQKRAARQTAGGGNKSAAAYSAAPAKRHAEEPETVKSESTPVYTAAKKSSSADTPLPSGSHYSSSGSRHSGSHGSLGEVSVYEQRRQQRDAARKDFWNHTLDLLGTASAQAGRGITGISVPVEQQLEESRRQIENVRAIREANARFEAARKPIEWDGRAELISALEQLDMQSGWEINEEQANAAEQQRQELLARLREGDLAAGNGVRSGTDADTGRDILESTAKGIAGAGVNAFSNLGQLMAKADAYTYSENEFLTDWMLGNDLSVMRQARIDAYNDPANQEKWQEIDAIADKLDNDAATVLRRAKEGKSIVGEAGVDVAKGVLEAGFDAGLAAVTGGSALVPLAACVYGQSVGTARRAGATLEQQAAYGLTSAAIEVASEMLFDGVAKIYGAGAADDIVEKLVVELAESDTGRGMLRFLAGAAGEGAEEVVSDLLSPLAEATYRDESLAELYRQLEPSELLYDYLIGAAISTLASGASTMTGQRGDASAEYRANEAEYLNILERNGLLPPESDKNAAHEGAATDNSEHASFVQDSAISQVSDANAPLYETDAEEYIRWSKAVGLNEAVKSLAEYEDIKYNDSPRFELLQRYTGDVESGWISPLIGFSGYEELYNRTQNEIVGQTTVSGLVITGQSRHFLQRLIGTMQDPKIYKEEHRVIRRSGVELEDIIKAVTTGTPRPIKHFQNGASQLFLSPKCKVSINPETGMLIQCSFYEE